MGVADLFRVTARTFGRVRWLFGVDYRDHVLLGQRDL